MSESDFKPIVYAALRTATVAGRVPPDVRRLLSDVTCCRCGSAALATSTALAEMNALAARSKRPLNIVCDHCVSDEKPNLMVVALDEEIERAAARDTAERN
jgi:hypothetical protein